MNIAADTFISFTLLAVVMSITPGPINILILASGVQFGIRRTLPQLFGTSIGCALMIVLVALGLHRVFEIWPFTQSLLKFGGAAYLLWLAYKITRAGSSIDFGGGKNAPVTMLGGAVLQWINPKAWIMSVSAVSTYLPLNYSLIDIAILTLTFAVINFPCVGVWGYAGARMQQLLHTPSRVRAFNYLAAALLVISLYPILSSTMG